MLPKSAAVNRREPSSRTRMNGEQRRQHFIDAALRLFSSSGFRGTSTKAIAEAAGASEALLFRHFASKADLYAAILQQRAEASGLSERFAELRQLAGGADDQAMVRSLVGSMLDGFQRDIEFERLMLYAALEGHELATVSRQLFGEPSFALLRDYVVQRQQAGAFRQGDPLLLVFALVALPAYFSLIHRVLGRRRAGVPDQASADLFTELVLDGVRQHGDDLPRQLKPIAGNRPLKALAGNRRLKTIAGKRGLKASAGNASPRPAGSLGRRPKPQ
jgi:TetR/AcrR family transcriptional regulator